MLRLWFNLIPDCTHGLSSSLDGLSDGSDPRGRMLRWSLR